MANYASLKATIQTDIKSNHNQEITGPILQGRLFDMIASLGSGYQLVGAAVPDSTPGTPDERVAYICATPGTYTGMGNIVVAAGEVAILGWDAAWSKLASWSAGGLTLAAMWDSLTNTSEDEYADVQINASHLAGYVTETALNETLESYVRNDAFDALTDLLAVHDGRISDLESLVASGGFGEGSAPDWFIVETYLDGVVSRQRLKLNPRYVGMYAEGYVSAGGISAGGGGGGGGITLDAMWNSLTNSVVDAYANTPINLAHIPDITVSKVTDIETWISGKGYITNADLSNYLPLSGGTMANTNLVTNMNADLLDGLHASDFALASSLSNYIPLAGGAMSGYITYPIWENGDTSMPVFSRIRPFDLMGASVSPDGSVYWSGLSVETNYVGFQFAHYGGDTTSLYYRACSDNQVYGSWHKFAFEDGNVASATSLQTSRSIWGQSFNGTANVSGAMTDVTSIDSLLYFDTTNARVGIGIGAPADTLDVNGSIHSTSLRIGAGSPVLVWDSVNSAWHLNGSFYADGFISAGGFSDTSGGGGIDLGAMWGSLTNSVPDEYANTPIALAHIPDITTAKVSNIETWISGKGYITNADLSNYLPLTGGTMANTNLVTNMNADLLDGLDSTDFVRYYGIQNPQASGFFSGSGYFYMSSGWNNSGPGFAFGTSWSHVQIQGAYTTDELSVRTYIGSLGQYGAWKTIAYIDGNVATATALQTSRSIWGQSFNGTADITGAMSSVSSIDSLLYFDTTNSRVGILTNIPGYSFDVYGTFNATTIYQNGVALGARAFDNTSYLPIAGGTMANTNLVTNMNADLLDGLDSTDFVRYYGIQNPQASGFFSGSGYFYMSSGWNNSGPGFAFGTSWSHVQIQGAYTTDELSVRTYIGSLGQYGAWKTIAYIDGNVATATALQTSRSIWGQSFNGTSDVSGALSGASTGEFSSWVKANYYYVGGYSAYLEYANSAIHANVGFYSNSFISAGGLSTSSDARLKTDVETIAADRAWQVVMGLRPAEFRWKENGAKSSGFIAQEVEPLVPFAVSEVGGVKRLSYDNIFTYGVAALRDLKIWRETTEQRIERLEKSIHEMQTEINRLRA